MPPLATPVTPFLTERQLADRWQVSDRTVRRMVSAGRLRPVRIGPGSVRFRATDIEALEAAAQEAA